MNIIIAVSNNNGLMFNNRRLSKDKVVREYINELADEYTVYMDKYSSKQFKEYINPHIIIDDNFLEHMQDNEFCFIEDKDIQPYTDKIKSITLIHWNRDYPADKFFNISLKNFNKVFSIDVQGDSHDDITMEVYNRVYE